MRDGHHSRQRGIRGMGGGFHFGSRKDGGTRCGGESRRAPYGLEIIGNCLSCPHREDPLFCNLPPPILQRLAAITSPSSNRKGDGPEPLSSLRAAFVSHLVGRAG